MKELTDLEILEAIKQHFVQMPRGADHVALGLAVRLLNKYVPTTPHHND